MKTQPISQDEQILYKYNNGEALVTTRRLVLGKESWPIEAIKDVSISAHEAPRRRYSPGMPTYKSLNEFQELSRFSYIGISLMIGAMLLGIVLHLESPWDTVVVIIGIVGFVLLVLGFTLIYVAPMKNPVERYNIRLTLKSAHGNEELYETQYTFLWQTPVLKTFEAIQAALAQNSSVSVAPS